MLEFRTLTVHHDSSLCLLPKSLMKFTLKIDQIVASVVQQSSNMLGISFHRRDITWERDGADRSSRKRSHWAAEEPDCHFYLYYCKSYHKITATEMN